MEQTSEYAWGEVEELLPDGYLYERLAAPSSYNFTSKRPCCFKITVLTSLSDHALVEYNKELAEAWLSQLAASHTVEFRKRGTPYHSPRPPAVYKTSRRCHHNTYSKSKTADLRAGSKNTNCPMHLKLIVNRPKNGEDHMEVHFHNNHNHDIRVPSTLCKRDVSVQTQQTLLELFRQGHTAASALANHKSTLQSQLSEEEFITACSDRSIIPNIQYVDKFYRDSKMEIFRSCDGTHDSAPNTSNIPDVQQTEKVARSQLRKVSEAKDQLLNLMAQKLDDYAQDKRLLGGIKKMTSDLIKVNTNSMMVSFLRGTRQKTVTKSRSSNLCQTTAVQGQRSVLGGSVALIGRSAGVKRTAERCYSENKSRKKSPNIISYQMELESSVQSITECTN